MYQGALFANLELVAKGGAADQAGEKFRKESRNMSTARVALRKDEGPKVGETEKQIKVERRKGGWARPKKTGKKEEQVKNPTGAHLRT